MTELSVDAFGIPTRATGTWAWAGGGSVKATLGPAPLTGPRDGPGRCRPARNGASHPRGRDALPADVTGTARAVLDDVAVGSLPLGRGQFDVTARDGVFRAELAFPEQRLRASGSARIDAGGILLAEAAVPDVDLAPLARALGSAPAALGGTLSARATARVPLAEPRRGEGVLSIDPSVSSWPVIRGKARAPPSFAGHRAASPWPSSGSPRRRRASSPDRQPLARTGSWTLGCPPRCRSPCWPTCGPRFARSEACSISRCARREARRRRLSPGKARFTDGNLLRDRPETLRDIEARFGLSSQGMQLSEATGSMGGGRVQARGDVALDGWALGATGSSSGAERRRGHRSRAVSSAWDADLDLSGTAAARRRSRDARASCAASTPRSLDRLAGAVADAAGGGRRPGPLLRLRVRVRLDDNLRCAARIADLRAGGVLSVEGTTARPWSSGRRRAATAASCSAAATGA